MEYERTSDQQHILQETFAALDTSERFQVMFDAQTYRALAAWIEHE